MESKKEKVRSRGRRELEHLIEQSGGYYLINDVIKLLKLSNEEIRSLMNKNDILFYRNGGEVRFPKYQFNDDRIINNIKPITELLKDEEPLGRVLFFLKYDDDLNKTPIAVLNSNYTKREFEMLKISAQQYNQHIAR